MRYFFIPIKNRDDCFMSLALDPSKCIYIPPIANIKNEKKFQKKTPAWKAKKLLKSMISAWNLLLTAKSNDCVISFGFSNTTILYSFMVGILRKKTKVLIVDYIEHDYAKGIKGFLKLHIFRTIFLNQNLYLTVNCMETMDRVINKFHINRTHMFELVDCVAWEYTEEMFTDGDNSVFMGGNIRDWNSFMQLANLMPDVKFVGVAGSQHFHIDRDIPQNVSLYFDQTLETYEALQKKSSVSLILLPSDVSNGFIAAYQSTFLNKPIVATSSLSLNKLLYDDQIGWGGVVFQRGDYLDARNKIYELLNNRDVRRTYCEKMQQIAAKHTKYAYSDEIKRIIEKMN